MTIMPGAELSDCGNQHYASASNKNVLVAGQIAQTASRILNILLMSHRAARPSSVMDWLCAWCAPAATI